MTREHYERWEEELMRGKHQKGPTIRWWEWIIAMLAIVVAVGAGTVLWEVMH